MTNQRAIILLSQMYLPAFDEEEKQAIDKAIEALTEQEPRVLTLGEYMTEAKKPKHERDPVWEEWIIEGWELKSGWCMPNPAYGGYGKSWRCWTSRPTDEQREATPWEEVEV